jgi:hypothetical protein
LLGEVQPVVDLDPGVAHPGLALRLPPQDLYRAQGLGIIPENECARALRSGSSFRTLEASDQDD